MILEIVKYPDPRLALISKPVAAITPAIKKLARDMLDTMYEAEGVGLAAPQIGQQLRMLVMDAGWRNGEKRPRIVINPVLSEPGELITSENEGCLSVPYGFRADVPRAASIHLKGLDLEGNELDEIMTGLDAIIIQHETDHLEGRLFIDKISRLRRNMYDSKVKKWQKGQE